MQDHQLTPIPENKTGKEPIWGVWATVGWGVLVMAVFLLSQGAAFVVYLLIKYLSNPQSLSMSVIQSLASNGFVLAIASTTSGIICTALVLFIVKLKSGANIRDYLALKRISVKKIVVLLGITLGVLILSSVIASLIETPGSNQFTSQAYQTAGPPVLFWLALVIFVPVFEEVFFRGFLFQGFSRSKIGIVGTIILTALLWAALHIQYDVVGMTTIFVLGIVFGVVRYKTGSLWSTIAMHTFWNLLGLIATAIFIASQ